MCRAAGVATVFGVSSGAASGFEAVVSSLGRLPEPSSVTLRAFRYDRLVYETTLEPTYERIYPNGEDATTAAMSRAPASPSRDRYSSFSIARRSV